MSVRRPQKDCSLCLSSLDEEIHKAIFYAYQEAANLVEAVARVKVVGVETTPEDLRRHIQYHRPVQPAPRGRFRADDALARGQSLPKRLRDILSLVGRVPALSGTHLAEFFYWDGREAQFASARAACYRDLSRLVKDNFLYRWYPATASAPSGVRVRAWQHRLSFYFLGRDAVPLIEKSEDCTLARGGDWISSVEDLPPSHELFATGAASENIAALARQARQMTAGGSSGAQGPAEIQLATNSWFGPMRLALANRGRQRPDWGLAAFRFKPQDQPGVLAPFLYEYDDGLRAQGDIVESLLKFIDLKRSGGLGDRVPQLGQGGFFPPLLVISTEPFRLESLRRSAQLAARKRGATKDLPIIVCADQTTVHAVGLSGESWVSLWDAAATPRRHRLVDVLNHQAKGLSDIGLTAESKLEVRRV